MLQEDFALPQTAVGGSDETGSGGTSGAGGDVGAGSGGCAGGAACGQGSTGGEDLPDSGTSPPSCGLDAEVGPNGDCYVADATEKTWFDARQSCQALGAGWDLATIRGTEENSFALTITGFEAWIGATDADREGTWYWVSDDAPFFDEGGLGNSGAPPYTNWNINEPNDADGSDCLRILTTGLWADWQCDSVKGYVCQQTGP